MELLKESSTLTSTGTKFRARLISEGTGSSATYPGDVLQRDGATALPAGTQIFFDHLMESDKWERDGNHSVKDLVGVTLTEAEWVEAEKALYADVNIFSTAKDFITEAMEFVGLSVEIKNFTLNESGAVEYLGPHPLNAVSVVPRAGRDGKITALIEGYREKSDTLVIEDGKDTGKDESVKPEDIQKIVEAMTPLFDGLKEALTPKEPEKPEAGAEEAPDHGDIVEAAIDAGLSKSSRARVVKAVDDGATLEEALKAEKDLREEILKESATQHGGTVKTAADADFDARVTGW